MKNYSIAFLFLFACGVSAGVIETGQGGTLTTNRPFCGS